MRLPFCSCQHREFFSHILSDVCTAAVKPDFWNCCAANEMIMPQNSFNLK